MVAEAPHIVEVEYKFLLEVSISLEVFQSCLDFLTPFVFAVYRQFPN